MNKQEEGLLKAIASGDEVARFAYADWLEEQGRGEEAEKVRPTGLIRKLEFERAWDKRDPDPNKDYGIHGVTMRAAVIGPKGAASFILYTNWQLPKIQEEWEDRARQGQIDSHSVMVLFRPQPADLGTHSPKPTHEGQTSLPHCQYLGGRPCYADGSGLASQSVFNLLTTGGDEAMWKYLEDYYRRKLV